MKGRKLLLGLGIVAILLAALWWWFVQTVTIQPPVPENAEILHLERQQPAEGFYTLKDNWIQKNELGLYEMYLTGPAFERGVAYGKLAKELVVKQERYFVGQIEQLIPSKFYQRFLKYLIGWFNRNLDEAIPLENQLEIYGVSQSAADDYAFIGSKYQRLLNYHAAHDIGHALQDKNMVVGCTSFGVWNEETTDSALLIGRNLDFYVGDSFAIDKIVMFMKPDNGHPFMMVTWGGMTGTVSGMNMAGLTVTINAGKSDYPTKAATPISILAREILQYAGNIAEAYAIAQKRETFVSESILIGSAADRDVAIIEKTPSKLGLYTPSGNEVVCANHFQSAPFQQDAVNLKHKVESSSGKREIRMAGLLESKHPLDYYDAAAILRDYQGINNTNIGIGNEDAINQLLAHHSIIFKPEERLVWVSANPVPFNAFVAYDLNKVFTNYPGMKSPQSIDEPALRIPADTFLTNGYYHQFVLYKQQRKHIQTLIKSNGSLSDKEAEAFIALNPEYFEVYELLGNYYRHKGNSTKAAHYFQIALTKDIPLVAQRNNIQQHMEGLQTP